MRNPLRMKYESSEQVVGTFFTMGDPSLMECLGYTGLDFVIIDTEHGPFDTETMSALIRTSERVGLSPVVRIADVTHKEIQRAADCGATGVIVPCLRTVDEFKKLVELAKYPPIGNRGFMKGRGCGFGYQPWASGTLEEYMCASNEMLMVIPQCETAESLAHIEEIAKLQGIDGIFIGPFDLSISMGIPGQFHHPEFRTAVNRITNAFHGEGKPVYIYGSDPETCRKYLNTGMDGVANGLSSVVIVEAYTQIVRQIKE